MTTSYRRAWRITGHVRVHHLKSLMLYWIFVFIILEFLYDNISLLLNRRGWGLGDRGEKVVEWLGGGVWECKGGATNWLAGRGEGIVELRGELTR